MISNPNRNGRATSSEIWKLLTTDRKGTGWGVPALTYIAEIQMERYLGRSIDGNANSKPTSWGSLLERHLFNKLPSNYQITSQETDLHPDYPIIWAGSKDGINHKGEPAVFDEKCPFTLQSFVQMVLPNYLGYSGYSAFKRAEKGFWSRGVYYAAHKDMEKYYWQLVSNACINKVDWAELIVYMPYRSELDAIKELADGDETVYWLNFTDNEQLPFIPDGGFFKNINTIRFKVPQKHKDLLTSKIEKLSKLLEADIFGLLAERDNELNTTIVKPL